MPTFCVLGTVSAFSSLAGAAASARFSLVEAAELLFSSASSSCSSLRGQRGLRGGRRGPGQTCGHGPATRRGAGRGEARNSPWAREVQGQTDRPTDRPPAWPSPPLCRAKARVRWNKPRVSPGGGCRHPQPGRPLATRPHPPPRGERCPGWGWGPRAAEQPGRPLGSAQLGRRNPPLWAAGPTPRGGPPSFHCPRAVTDPSPPRACQCRSRPVPLPQASPDARWSFPRGRPPVPSHPAQPRAVPAAGPPPGHGRGWGSPHGFLSLYIGAPLSVWWQPPRQSPPLNSRLPARRRRRNAPRH